MRILVVGATGMVGFAICQQLAKRSDLQITGASRLTQVAQTDKIKQENLATLKQQGVALRTLDDISFEDFDVAFFSAGAAVSEQYVPQAISQGVRVIDNTSFFRMHDEVPLVVPGINDEGIADKQLIANPNCSTIQLVYVLDCLQKLGSINDVDVVSIQSISGAGSGALAQLNTDTMQMITSSRHTGMAFDIDTKIDRWMEQGVCKEEWKIQHESKKILGLDSVRATCVRVPVLYGHTQSVTIRFDRRISHEECATIFNNSEAIVYYDIHDDFSPMRHASGNGKVHVGRMRLSSDGQTLRLIIMADNVLRGGATNAVEIGYRVFDQLKENHGIR